MTISTAALAAFQSSDVAVDHLRWLTIFVGLIAASLVVAAISMALIAGYVAKLLMTVNSTAKEVKDRIAPLLDRTHTLVQDLAPKIQTMTTNAESISSTVRLKVDELAVTVTQLNATAQHVNSRAQAHVAHADGIVHDALNAAEQISNTVQEGIKAPLRQAVGVVAGVRAGLDKLLQMSPFGR